MLTLPFFFFFLKPIMKATAPKESKVGREESRDIMYALSFGYNIVQVILFQK